MAAPTVRGVGTESHGAPTIFPGLPAGTVAGDLLVMFIESDDVDLSGTDWLSAPNSPQTVTGTSRLTVLYKIAVGGDSTSVTGAANHAIGKIIGVTAGTFDTANPFNTSAGGIRSVAGTTATIPGSTTTVADCLVLAVSAHERDQTGGAFTTASWANADLTGIAQRINDSTNAGNGGGLGGIEGVKAAAGAYGATTVTVQSSVGGMISLAIQPPQTPADTFVPRIVIV